MYSQTFLTVWGRDSYSTGLVTEAQAWAQSTYREFATQQRRQSGRKIERFLYNRLDLHGNNNLAVRLHESRRFA